MKSACLLFASVFALAVPALASATGRWLNLMVVDRNTQRELPVYRHEGRSYIAGEPGHRYQIRLRNPGDDRVLGVLSVDGINVISGDTADWSQTGYVLDGYQSSDILGWRKSLSQVADFVFADAARSYAARTGRPDNVGVIGLAVFLPRAEPMPMPPPMAAPAVDASSRRAAPAMPAPAPPPFAEAHAKSYAGLPVADAPLGTGHGPREHSSMSYTDFVRASASPDEVITLYYDTRQRLVAQGVIPPDDAVADGRPNPFPAHFVPDPR